MECIKESGFFCFCPDCQRQLAENNAKHEQELKARQQKAREQIASYWTTGNFTNVEQQTAIHQHFAGYEEPLVRCQRCKTKYDRRIGAYEKGVYSYCPKCCL